MYRILFFLCIVMLIVCANSWIAYRESFNANVYNTVMQTVADKNIIPPKVAENWKTFAPGVERVLMNDKECIQFLKDHFGEQTSEKFMSFKSGAHKADLFRYAWLYVNGGIYMDIKTVLIKPFHELFPNPNLCYLVVTDSSFAPKNRIYNGIIATPPKNPLMLKLLKGTMQMTNEHEYIHNCEEGFRITSSLCEQGLQSYGLNKTIPSVPDVYVLKETPKSVDHCEHIPDRYNQCMFIVDGDEKVIKVRYSDYPW